MASPFDFQDLFVQLEQTKLVGWIPALRTTLANAFGPEAHGKMSEWVEAVQALPPIQTGSIDLHNGVILKSDSSLSKAVEEALVQNLQTLHPWRKGPFSIFGTEIDTEWRSNLKWDRLSNHISDLSERRILDIGSGNGYYGWRMIGAGARFVCGLDPFPVYNLQFHAINRYLANHSNYVLPIGVEGLPAESRTFDTVFSMGVLYHRRSPFDHLITCRDALRSGGELVLETIVTDGPADHVLVPEGRYAQMRNVWFLPSTLTLESWLLKCKFKEIELIDVSPTTTHEQRTTEWMRFHSLADFLDPADSSKTVEGHPAPKRAIFRATAP